MLSTLYSRTNRETSVIRRVVTFWKSSVNKKAFVCSLTRYLVCELTRVQPTAIDSVSF